MERSSFASFLWPPAERKEARYKQKKGIQISLKLTRSFFDKIAGTAFWQSDCTDFMQKDSPDQSKGVSFCRPILRQVTFRGWQWKFFKFRKNPLFSVMPYRKRFHKSEHPI